MDKDICDICEKNPATGAVAGPRPSFTAEIVSVLYACDACTGGPVDLIETWDGQVMVFAYFSAWEDYIMSPKAQENGHIFLTV